MTFDELKELLETKEMGLYNVSEVQSITVVDDSMVVVYHLVGAEAHHASSHVVRCSVVKGGRVTNSIIVKQG